MSGMTIVEKIIARHCGQVQVKPGDIVDLAIDVRLARDFGGANVVQEIEAHGLSIAEPQRTFFTFDCNPTGSDQKYAANQQLCRLFARKWGIKVFDIDAGIGTHLAIDRGLVAPGETLISTDSHANILGAIGAFGQGMGDKDIAWAWAKGRVWFEVPPTVKIELLGIPGEDVTPKDVGLALLRHFGANGLLGCAAEVYGEYPERLSLDARITIASLGTEMGAVIIFFPPNKKVLDYCRMRRGQEVNGVYADPDAVYNRIQQIDLTQLEPLISRPGHPEDVVLVREVAGRKIDSVFIGSCTNGRMEDLQAAAQILKDRNVAPGVVLKIVPATDEIWQECLKSGILRVFKRAGALIGNAGCAGCAAGQVGQNGPGEVTVSTGNRNFTGKQGKGEVYLASPKTAAASAVAGIITTPDRIPDEPVRFEMAKPVIVSRGSATEKVAEKRPLVITGRVWAITEDNIDTDQIYHNRHLAVTDIREMGQYAFGNLKGWEDFPKRVKPGDIIVTGKNFGAGSSRQQAVDCFKSLGIALIIAESFGAIYFRNAVNAGLAVMTASLVNEVQDGDVIEVNLVSGEIQLPDGRKVRARPLSPVQAAIYRRGGLLEQ
ncbi:MAG: aconitase/3-isopropylmalate dehydratase large subunit family protein [bacterium]